MRKYQSKIAKTVHETMEGMYVIGLLNASQMHEFDVDCLVPSAVPNREAVSIGTADPSRSPIPAVAAPRT